MTKEVMKSLVKHAFDVKILALETYWNNDQLADQQQLYADKRAAQAKIEVIEDLKEIEYETFASYFD